MAGPSNPSKGKGRASPIKNNSSGRSTPASHSNNMSMNMNDNAQHAFDPSGNNNHDLDLALGLGMQNENMHQACGTGQPSHFGQAGPSTPQAATSSRPVRGRPKRGAGENQMQQSQAQPSQEQQQMPQSQVQMTSFPPFEQWIPQAQQVFNETVTYYNACISADPTTRAYYANLMNTALARIPPQWQSVISLQMTQQSSVRSLLQIMLNGGIPHPGHPNSQFGNAGDANAQAAAGSSMQSGPPQDAVPAQSTHGEDATISMPAHYRINDINAHPQIVQPPTQDQNQDHQMSSDNNDNNHLQIPHIEDIFHQPTNTQTQAQPQPATAANSNLNQAETEYETSTLHIGLSCPLIVTGDSNIISHEPSTQVDKITRAIIAALKGANSDDAGIPMKDSNGEPRGIRVDVMAEIRVNGSRNSIGERAAERAADLRKQEMGINAKAMREAAVVGYTNGGMGTGLVSPVSAGAQGVLGGYGSSSGSGSLQNAQYVAAPTPPRKRNTKRSGETNSSESDANKRVKKDGGDADESDAKLRKLLHESQPQQ